MKTLFKLFLIMVLSAAGLAAYGTYSFLADGPLDAEKTIYFERGTGFRSITQRLVDEGVIREAWSLRAAAFMSRSHTKFQAGEYVFAAHISAKDAMQQIIRGQQVHHKITIPEGLTSAEISQRLEAEPLLTGAVPLTLAEGSLLPNTYVFLRGDSRERVTTQMQKAMREALEAAWNTRTEGLPLATPEEALVLASIVEKETGVADERAKIAGVFINRLRMGMKLQSDPTTAYAVTLADGSMNRALTYDDLKRNLPHNTYVTLGLPPTPICNPGVAAINAVLHPQATDALFFVANGTGGHSFAATLAEHEKNVAYYRSLQR